VLQAIGLFWLALILTPTTAYTQMVPAFIVAGLGMTMFFVPIASLVLGSVNKDLEGVASGTNAAFRELGGVFGIAILGAVFSSSGGYLSAQDYVNGLRPAIFVGAGVVVLGFFAALLVPRRRPSPFKSATRSSASGRSHFSTHHANSAPRGDISTKDSKTCCSVCASQYSDIDVLT